MKTSRQMRRRRRIAAAIAYFTIIMVLTLANFGAYCIGSLILSIINAIFTLIILFNFPYYKFK